MSVTFSIPGPNQQTLKCSKWVGQGAHLIDVRTPQEYATGHITGARNVPVQELAGRLDAVGRPGDKVVVYCRSGARSAYARGILEAAGFEVCDAGSMSAWQ